ncbi:MAG: hypothetical protein JNN08_04380 [Bryobacterales bacterium]|nr:hypothetical protein [Bryobacterales bacterium]
MLFAVALSSTPNVTFADVVFQHVGNTLPSSEGWMDNDSEVQGDVIRGPVNDGGILAWFVNDNSTDLSSSLRYVQIPSSGVIGQGNTHGWRIRAIIRIVNHNDEPDYSVHVTYRTGQQTWGMMFGSEPDGDPIVRLGNSAHASTGIDLVLQGLGDGYHLYELVYDPSSQTADLFVDGVERVSNFAGYLELSSADLFQWGSASSFTAGHGRYALVELAVGPLNRPPVANCISRIVAAGAACSAPASVDGGSYDPDGDPITSIQTPPGPYSVGISLVELTVTDMDLASSQCQASVTVQDQTPPLISAAKSIPSSLWPPNGKMAPVTISATASDVCSSPVACRIIAVASNEPVSAQGDWLITGNLSLDLRVARRGDGNGRVYTITIECKDGAGNASTRQTTVSVPHNRGN